MKDKRNRHMAQWVNRLWNNIFVNLLPLLPLLCEISGALHLAQLGLMAGRQADEIQVNFKIFKIGCRSKYSALFNHHYNIIAGFSSKAYCKVDF